MGHPLTEKQEEHGADELSTYAAKAESEGVRAMHGGRRGGR